MVDEACPVAANGLYEILTLPIEFKKEVTPLKHVKRTMKLSKTLN
jgi:hypothetical protein